MKKNIKFLAFTLCVMMLLSTVACNNGEISAETTVTVTTEAVETTSREETSAATEAPTSATTEPETNSEAVTETQKETDPETLDSSVNTAESGEMTETSAESETTAATDTTTATETKTEEESESETEGSEFVITENGDGASVVTRGGFEYSATGYISADDSYGFNMNQGLEITFPEGALASEFNRFTIDYSSSVPLKAFVTYTVDGEDRTDYYYLEAIKTSFKGLVETYLDGKGSTELKKIVFNTCEEDEGYFILRGVSLDTVEYYPDDVFVENERFKVGVRLSWGGSMTYFEDKMDGIDDLANLVNIHDTGRLIQQSFYGTYTNDEYTSGNYSNSTWPYNPVQGGNKFQKGRTRLIDIEVGDDYIYVKVQSLDWALNDVLTHTYYENTYVLQEDNVLVDNRMVDFSGWKHVQAGQEIPAMYIVSYFGTLAYYNGVESWTDDMDYVYYERELGGWGASVTVPIVEGNDETWCIWMNETDDFCFGIYTPNIDRLIAIRHQYDGSKDPMANSTSYVATSSIIEMVSYCPVEYQYLLATGSFEDVRENFKENKDFSDNESLNNNKFPFRVPSERFDVTDLDLTVKGNEKIFSGNRVLDTGYDEEEGAAIFTLLSTSDPYTFIDFKWNSDRPLVAEDYNVFEIEYMIPTTNSKNSYYISLFLCAGSITSAKEGYNVSAALVADGEYHTVSIRLPKDIWSGRINKIRIDIVDSGAIGDVVFVKHIRLLKYPDLSAENDFSVQYADKLIGSPARTEVYYSEEEKAVALKVIDTNDVGVYFDFSGADLSTVIYDTIEITYMMPKTNSKSSYSYQLFYTCGENTGLSEKRSFVGTYAADGEYHTLTIKLDEKEGWSGDIKKIRFDYFSGCAVGDVIYIKSVNFIPVEGYSVYSEENKEEDVFYHKYNTTATYDGEEGATLLTVSGGKDVYVITNLTEASLDTADYTKLVITYMVPTTNSKSNYSACLYFTTSESTGFDENKSISAGSLTVDGSYHILVIDLTKKSEYWTGNIAKLRFDYFQSACADGDQIYIQSIKLQ